MKLRPSLTALALLSLWPVGVAFGQTASDFANLRQELKRLREEVDALKKDKAATGVAAQSAASVSPERVEQLEAKAQDAVVKGDIAGGFRLPGSDTSIRVYGFAEAHVLKDFKATAPGDDFSNLPEQPLSGSGATTGKTKLTAQTSRFGFETSTPTGQGPFTTKLEMDFYAYCGSECNRGRLRVRHAYGQYAGWLIGQTWSTFMDLDGIPETVDFNGPIGTPFSRKTMIRYAYPVPEVATFTVAVEDPEDGARWPNLVARVDKTFDWGAVNLRVLRHEKRVGTESKTDFGFGLGGSFKLTDKDLLVGQYTRVAGDIDNLYGGNGYAVDADGRLVFDKNQGLAVGWTRVFGEKLRGTVGFGMNRGTEVAVFDNRSLKQLHANLIYSPIKNVELGTEYVHGLRKTLSGERGTLSRLDLMGRYSF